MLVGRSMAAEVWWGVEMKKNLSGVEKEGKGGVKVVRGNTLVCNIGM